MTFRLADSMPESRRGEWEHLLTIEDIREKRTKLEKYLDRGVGDCHLRDSRIAKLCEDALLFFHNERYELLSWCVMPNHVHALVHIWETPLWKVIKNWKIHVINEHRGMLSSERRAPSRLVQFSSNDSPRRPPVPPFKWQREYWDTFMRDERQEKTGVRYIENNPVKAKLCRVSEDWQFSSARFRDEYRRLKLPAKNGTPSTASASLEKR